MSVYDTAAVTAVRISGRIFQPVSYPQRFESAQKRLNILLQVTVRQHPFSNYYLFQNYIRLLKFKGWAVALWLRHYATNRQVAGSIPDGVIGIFQ